MRPKSRVSATSILMPKSRPTMARSMGMSRAILTGLLNFASIEDPRSGEGVDDLAALPDAFQVAADEGRAIRGVAEVAGQNLPGDQAVRLGSCGGFSNFTVPGDLVRPPPSRAWNWKSRDMGGSLTLKYFAAPSTRSSCFNS